MTQQPTGAWRDSMVPLGLILGAGIGATIGMLVANGVGLALGIASAAAASSARSPEASRDDDARAGGRWRTRAADLLVKGGALAMATNEARETVQPATERGRATRQALHDAAEEVFGELSFDRASVAEITRRAGVAQGTFYVYFADNQAAFTDLARELNRSMRHALTEAITGLDDRIAMERAGFRAFFDFIMDHRALYKLVREAEFVDIDIYREKVERSARRYLAG